MPADDPIALTFKETAMTEALIPTWILGAPLVLAIIDWLRTPKPH